MSGDSRDPNIPSEDAVIPPPPREAPIPDGLLSPPSTEASIPDAVIPPADVVIPPPPPEAMLPTTRRSRPKPAILTGEQPAPVAADWAQPSVAPEVPTSGGYRVLSAVIFGFLLVLLIAAVAAAFYLGSVTFALGEVFDSVTSAADEWRGWHG
jgi:hypothetical protein